MKKIWQPEELVEHWTLLPEELELLANKNEPNSLGFALLFKFFQFYARFPQNPQEIPSMVIEYVAKVLRISPEKYSEYDWQGRLIKYHRSQIRNFFGFREARVKDARELTEWLASQALIYELKYENLNDATYTRLRELKIEPPTPKRLERIIRSAIRLFEERFFSATSSELSLHTKTEIDKLLRPKTTKVATENNVSQTNNTFEKLSSFSELKSDPGRIGVESFHKEINKLEVLRSLELPLDLFKNIPIKVLQIYKQRVAVEHPRDLRRHPEAIRYTIVATFCYLRSQEVTDNLVELMIQIVHRIGARAEKRVDKELLNDFKKVTGKNHILFQIASASINQPFGVIKDVIFPVASEETLKNLVKEYKSTGNNAINGCAYHDLLYVKRRFIQKEQLRNAIASVANAIFQARLTNIWGEATTACASDSKKFGAWDQNLMTEWHIRYGGRGVMIYWHVEKNSVCIYSQLKTCSSSEVAAMMEGLLRHCTEMKVEKNYVDTHGQSVVAFAFCHLLGFQLMPRLKGIDKQKLYRPSSDSSNAYPNLQPVLTRSINWDLIRQQYDQMVKYATALRLGTAETEAILKRFTKANLMHPTYQALCELGKVIKTIFLCQYLHSIELRREINEGLNIVENWNSANSFIFYGKGGEIATNRLEDQELAVLSLHLLQISLVYINTLMIQRILKEPEWIKLMQPEDFRALSPLIWAHVNPYGTFRLNMDERLPIEAVVA